MERTIIDMNNIENLVINGDIFIIPNRAAKIQDFFDFAQEEKKEIMEKICRLNERVFDVDNEHCLETWICSEEFQCDNVADHNIHTLTTDGQRVTIGIDNGRYIPSSLFKGHKEGETIEIKIPIWISISHAETPINTVVTFRLTLSQTKYRYRIFGNFEEVFDRVCY